MAVKIMRDVENAKGARDAHLSKEDVGEQPSAPLPETLQSSKSFIIQRILRQIREDARWIAEVSVVIHLHTVIVFRYFFSDVVEMTFNRRPLKHAC